MATKLDIKVNVVDAGNSGKLVDDGKDPTDYTQVTLPIVAMEAGGHPQGAVLVCQVLVPRELLELVSRFTDAGGRPVTYPLEPGTPPTITLVLPDTAFSAAVQGQIRAMKVQTPEG